MHAFDRALGGLSRLLRLSGQAVLIFMMVSICYDAVMRYAFAAPTQWSLEVNTFLLAYIALVPAADVLRRGQQLNIGFVYSSFGRTARLASRAVAGAVGVAFCAVLTWRGAIMAWQAWEYGERMSSTLGTPMVLPFGLIPVGFGLLGLQFLADLINALRGKEPEAVGAEEIPSTDEQPIL